MTNDQLDQHLDNILRAAGLVGLKYVPWMTKEAIDDMRNALRVAITAQQDESLRDDVLYIRLAIRRDGATYRVSDRIDGIEKLKAPGVVASKQVKEMVFKLLNGAYGEGKHE